MSIGQELLNVPMGRMIREMAFAIADAQLKLDQSSIETAEMMGGLKTITDDEGNTTFDDSRVFFGAEYMTVAEAVATQVTGGDNDPVLNLVKQATDAMKPVYVPFPPGEYDSTTPPTYESDKWQDLTVTTPETHYQTYNAQISAWETALKDTNRSENGKTNLEEHLKQHRDKNQELFSKLIRVPTRVSMLELGFAPVFYSFVDTIIEVKISISISRSSSSSRSFKRKTRSGQFNWRKGSVGVTTSQVNASYSSKFSYSAEGSSLLRTKLSPIPTPVLLEERIRALMDVERERQEIRMESIRDKSLSTDELENSTPV